MGARGKQSAADLAVVRVSSAERPEPWPNLSEREATYWRNVCASLPADWFRPSDLPLLNEYCRAIVLAEDAHRAIAAEGAIVNGRPSAWHGILAQQVKSMVAIAARLRLAPQARFDRTQAVAVRPERGRRRPESVSSIVRGVQVVARGAGAAPRDPRARSRVF